MGPGLPPRRPVPLSGSAGTARSSQRWGQPRSPGVSAPGLEQVSGEDRWSPRHAGLGSARPWGLGFSTVGSWGESRGCLSVDGSSGSWGPHLRPPPRLPPAAPTCDPPRLPPAAHPQHTCALHSSGPGLPGSLFFRLRLGPGATMVWGKGTVFMLRQATAGAAGVTRPGHPTLQPTLSMPCGGTPVSTPHSPPQPFGTQGRR